MGRGKVSLRGISFREPRHPLTPTGGYGVSVAQMFNLPYRRFVIGRTLLASGGWQVKNQLCSARKTLAAFCLSLPARNERGESWREGKLKKSTSSPRPSPPFLRRRGRESAVARSKQIFCRTQLVKYLRYSRIQFCATGAASRLNRYTWGEGIRRTSEGDRHRFKAPTHAKKRRGAFHG